MAEKYEKNGYGGSDFKRNAPQEHSNADQDGDENSATNTSMTEKAGEYMRELLAEKLKIDQQKFPVSARLIDQEVSRVQSLGRIPTKDQRYVDVYKEKPIKVTVKAIVPVKEHPKFNFVGKLLGPKGNSMKKLQEETMCKMAVLGRGSMKDKKKEEELRNALDPKYAHLSDDLHVEITALGPPAEAHARIAYALAEVRKYLVPDSNDMIRHEQMREMQDPNMPPHSRPPHHPPMVPIEPPTLSVPPRTMFRPPVSRGIARGAAVRTSAPPRTVQGKTKVMSILDRARAAMEETYGHEEGYEVPPPIREEEYYPSAYEEVPEVYPPPPHHHHHHGPPPPHHYGGSISASHRHHESATAVSTAVAESYHYPPTRHHSDEYDSSVSSSHRRSYKLGGSRSESHSSGVRRAGSSTREPRYRSSPYTRPSK